MLDDELTVSEQIEQRLQAIEAHLGIEADAETAEDADETAAPSDPNGAEAGAGTTTDDGGDASAETPNSEETPE